MDDEKKQPRYIISFDLETTGLSVMDDEIVEIGLVVRNVSEPTTAIEPFRSLVFTDRKVCEEAAAVTGITNETIKDAKRFPFVFDSMVQYLDATIPEGSERILTGYNIVKYDLPLMFSVMCKYGKDPQFMLKQLKMSYVVDMLPYVREHVDTTKMKRGASGKCSFRLGDVYESLLDKKLDGAHGAVADALAVVELVCNGKDCNFVADAKAFTCEDYSCNMFQMIKDIGKRVAALAGRKRPAVRSVLDMFNKKPKQQ